jgi:uncharacterized damage-inducible protein DinB
MHPRELLIDTLPHMPPIRAIEGLSSELAEKRPSGAPHSAADILAHMTFWQDWFVRRCEGVAEPMALRAADGWPPVARGAWPELTARFAAGLERLAALGERPNAAEPIAPAIEFPALAAYTIQDALVHVANHNAHHLGQIVLVRQLMGVWPPPTGSWTW